MDLYLYEKQLKHFELYEKAGLHVYVVDGFGHKDYYNKNKRYYVNSYSLRNFKPISDRLRFNGREIVIEFDDDNWIANIDQAYDVKSYLQENLIPFELITTGGRGLRFHIFTYNKYNQSTIFALYLYLCKLIGINYETSGYPENYNKDHCVGVIGKQSKRLGYFATHYEYVPEHRPKTTIAEIKIPNEINLWDVPMDFLFKALEYASTIPEKKKKETYGKYRYRKPITIVKWH